MSERGESCFHCGLPVPAGARWRVEIGGAPRPMCCPGCEAVARTIVDAGLADYYRHRTALAPTAREPVPDLLAGLAVWDHPAIQRALVRDAGEVREAALLLEDLNCAACVWLTEQRLRRLDGVRTVAVNFATRRATVAWDPRRTGLAAILGAIRAIGFRARPYDPRRAQELLERERRDKLLRWLVAGALGMQVMMLAEALYAGDWFGIEPGYAHLFRWVSLLLTVPILVFSARPFFAGAWRDLAARRVGMDVPVAAGLALAFLGSLQATLANGGAVYYDSVAMFVFLLLGARLLETVARARAAREQEGLVRAAPATARRLDSEGRETVVPTVELAVGERVRVLPGETMPADGVVVAGVSSLDESLLTGESRPVARRAGERVTGGAVNVESPLEIEVTAVGDETVLAGLLRLVESARGAKPELARLADRAARWFVAGVLVLAAAVGVVWWRLDAARALPVVVSVLVVTCPCALALATPMAFAVAGGALARRGLLATRGHAIEGLAAARTVVFDKTGTLTEGRLRVVETVAAAGRTAGAVLAAAAALERGSEHPIARAIERAAGMAGVPPVPQIADVVAEPGRGLVGRVAGERWAVGSPEFVRERLGAALPSGLASRCAEGLTPVVVAGESGVAGLLLLEDSLRPGAAELVAALRREGRRVALLSGDQEATAGRIAAAAGIADVEGGASPARKLERVRELAAAGAPVAMVGDGVNDAAALGAAAVSVAMGNGAWLAAATADAVLLSGRLEDLAFAFVHAARTLRVVRQNLALALLYNLAAIPLAAAGVVPPWAAALGMSASSALVVLNALRLRARGPGRSARAPAAAAPAAALVAGRG
jgi:Cu2+-exporting ATPase